MRIEHYFDEKSIKGKRELLNLIEECDIVYDKKISALIDETADKSLFCVYDKGHICAFASILDEDSDIYIGEIYVEYASRKRGIAKELLRQSLAYAKAKGYEFVTLCVGYSNLVARRLYEKNKFIYNRAGTSLATMKRYVSNGAYHMGAILYEVSKQCGVRNLVENIDKIDSYENFYKYYDKADDEKIKKLLKSEELKVAAELIEELFNGRTLVADEIINGKLDRAKGTKFENAKNLKKSALGAKVFWDFKNQEKVMENIVKYEEKSKKSLNF